MKRLLVILMSAMVMTFMGCGDGSTEAKELLNRLLQVVGIPHEMVVNICQDGNSNGICDATELQTKITITQGDTAESIWQKITLNPDGTYLLEHYDPTKKILMEIEDKDILKDKEQRVTLEFNPKDPEEIPVQELSILQALIDSGLMQEQELASLRDSTIRSQVDTILLENIFQNQALLEENNVPTEVATVKNLEYIAEGLRDINISGDFVATIESCENNSSCQEQLLEDANQQTEINKEEAEVIAETNSTEGTGDRSTILTVEENNTTT